MAVPSAIKEEILSECKYKLLILKQELFNRMMWVRTEFLLNDKVSGDEGDQSIAHREENTLLLTQNRIRNQLLEIDSALSRIEQGTYGICEETHEPIELNRLLALPFTRLSIEGAEIREAHRHRFAR